MNKEIQLYEGRILSTDLVDIINTFREIEGKKTVLEHKDFMKKIRKEVKALEEIGINDEGNFSLVKYIDKKGEERPCYSLNRDGMLEMLNSESALVRYKTVEYINNLEGKISELEQEKAKLLLDIYNGGQAGVSASKRLSELEKKPLLDKIEEDEPKVEAYDEYMDSDGMYCLTNVAKMLGVQPRAYLIPLLRDKGYISKRNTLPTTKGVKVGFKIVATKEGYQRSKITPIGVEFIRKLIKNDKKRED